MGWTVYNSDGKILQSAELGDNAVTTVKILDDAVTADKLANSINTEITANTAKTGITSGQASAITANTAKVTNATHSGEVTGATALTIVADTVTNAKLANMVANTVKVNATGSTADPSDISMASANLSGAIADGDVLLIYDASTTSLKTVAKSVLVAGLGGAALTGSTDNTIVTVTGANAMTGESVLTYTGGILQLDYDSGSAEFKLDGSNGKAAIQLKNAGTAKWDMGMDGDGSSQQKSHVDDFGIYNHDEAKYVVVVAGTGSNRGGLGVHAGIATDGNEIPASGITTGTGTKAYTDKGFISCRVKNTTAQSIDSGGTTIVFAAETGGSTNGYYDTDSMWTSSTPRRITFTTAGYYLVNLNYGWSGTIGNATKTDIIMRRNGGGSNSTLARATNPTMGANERHGNMTLIYYFSAADYIEFLAYHNSSSTNPTIMADNDNATMCEVFRLG